MYYLCRDQNRHIYYMNMRSLKYFSFGVIGMVLASCVEEKNLYNPDEGTPEDTQLGLSTDFLLKTQRSIFITAVDGDGKSQAGVKFGVFMSQPYTGEGVISIDPVFVGYTDASGKLKAEVVIGNNVSKIYVAPLTAGYGQVKEADVQDFVSLDFQGVSFPHMAVSRAFSIEIPSFSGPISGLYQLYIPYKNVEISRDGIPLQGGCSLVSKEQLSPALINQIDSWYPERQNVQKADLDKNSDLRVVDENGARVWVTYVGDGGFYVANQTVYNSLMYYNYKEEELNSPNDIDHLRMTMLLPNTNQLQCPSGLKVQLLYWNGKEYTEIFPKGTRIGFVVARAGYKKDGTDVTTKNAYSFKNKTNPVVNGDVSGMYYSTPVLNKWGKSQAVTRQLDGYNCCVTGFDIRPFGDNQSDYDFNDVMLKVTATPEKAIEPGEDIPVDNVSMMKFNPFIFVNNRSHEIHLTDFAPTSKMDTNLLQTADDCSDASRNIYYRMEDMSCWALDFPRTSASDPAWRYPKEKSSVVKAYKNYSKWVINKTDLSWFDFTISENVDEDELY